MLTDNRSSSDVITHQNSILEELRKEISIEILPASHQFLNVVESTIKVFKAINRIIAYGAGDAQVWVDFLNLFDEYGFSRRLKTSMTRSTKTRVTAAVSKPVLTQLN